MWYKEKFVYYSNTPGFYAIYFLGKNYFDAIRCIIGTSKYLTKKKKTIIIRNTNLFWCLLDCLFCLSKLLLLLLTWWLSPPFFSPLFRRQRAARRASPGTLRIARNFTHRFTHRYPINSLPVTLRTTNAESENIATLEVKYRTSRTNYTHRIS